jgi:hexokinase
MTQEERAALMALCDAISDFAYYYANTPITQALRKAADKLYDILKGNEK